jgi:hypothetical protein
MKKLIAFGFILFMSACATVPQHSIQLDQVQSFKLVGVSFKGAENIASWPSEEENFRKQPNIDAQVIDRLRAGSAQNVPEIHAFFAKRLVERFESNFNNTVGSALNGTRPVKAIVAIKKLIIPSTAMRVLVSNTSVMSADITLIDAKTSAEILKYDGVESLQPHLGGVGALVLSVTDLGLSQENSLMADYFLTYKKWLTKE